MEPAEINALIREAEQWLVKARRAVGEGNKSDAIYHLARALALVQSASKAVKS